MVRKDYDRGDRTGHNTAVGRRLIRVSGTEPEADPQGDPMEQFVVALSPFTRRSRSLGVSHRDHYLTRGLEPGEHVLVHDPLADEHFRAVVADIEFELDDTSYRLEIGGRITAEEADEWLVPPAGDEHLTTGEIVALLEELRRSERDVSAALADLRAR